MRAHHLMMENAKSYPYPEVSKRFEDYMIFDVIVYGDEIDDFHWN